MPNWLRWILVLPASLGAYVGIQVLVGLSSELIALPWFLPADWKDAAQNWWSQGLNSIVGPIALIYAGVLTSPRGHRFHTGIALAVLFGVIVGGISALSLFSTELSHPRWWLLTTTAASIITVVMVCIRIQRTEGSNANPARPAAPGFAAD